MRIIADSGSTKTNWYILSDEGEVVQFESKGLNPYIVRTGTVYKEIKSNFPKKRFSPLQVKELYFYGSGCSGSVQKELIFAGLERYFPATIIHVFHDLLGAARSLWGKEHGLVAILGTGSSTALYDGRNVSEQVPSLGYILGDEGSGAYLGKRLLKAYLENELPVPLSKKFNKAYKLDLSGFLEHVYKDEYPNRFLGQMTYFIKENMDHPYMRQLVEEAFDAFFEHQILKYQHFLHYDLRCAGSVAFHFRDILQEAADDAGINLDKVVQDPMPGLIEHHNQYLEL